MKTLLAVLPLSVLCGCLSPVSLPSVSHWLIEYRDPPAVAGSPRYGVVRLVQAQVEQPYSGDQMVVLRKDGTVAFDAYNVFAAPASALLRGVGCSALRSSGLFSDVIGASSGAAAEISAEIVVSRLAIDCRQEDSRRTVAEVLVRLLSGRGIVATATGDGSADASDGDYGVAFSKALSTALSSALSKMR